MIYDFKCASCERVFSELFLSRRDAEQNEQGTPCPTCGKIAARVIGPVAVRFDGDGWTRKGAR